tara:strand:+ start:94164 stop:95111 length:948 start_codon:yes stop_codon:yes gene_type:complete
MKWSNKAIRAKIESTYGTDSTPAAGTDDVLIMANDVSVDPVQANAIPREVVRSGGEFGSYTEFLTGKHVAMSFAVEMAGAGGAVADVPAYGPLLRACGLAQTVNASTSVEYDPSSDSDTHEAVSLYINIGGKLHKMLGSRGNVSFEFSTNQIPMLRFSFMGLFVAVADESFPGAIDYSGYTTPVVVSDTNTPTLTLHGTALNCESLSVDLGNQVEYRELVNSTSIPIVDRKSVGSVVFEDVLVATKAWEAAVVAETLGALQVVHGTAVGNVCQIDAPKVQLKNPRPSGNQNKRMLTFDLVLTPNAGDDEFTFTTT